MRKREPQRSWQDVLLGIGFCLMAQAASAAPPATKMVVQVMHSGTVTEAPAGAKLPSRLDLALPSGYGRASEGELSSSQRRGVSMDALRASLPSLGASGENNGSVGRILSRPEALARNFKREGLPIAKLFQSENSLVHIGLSPKGKPGLWIVEKLH